MTDDPKLKLATLPLVLLTGALASSCAPVLPPADASSAIAQTCPQAFAKPKPDYYLCAVGSRDAMLDSGDLSGQIALSDLPADDELVAVGPVAGLQGEVTIYRGNATIATLTDGEQSLRSGPAGDEAVEAIFLAYGAAQAWEPVVISQPLEGFDAIEAFIALAARDAGLDPQRAFPFRIEGAAERLSYHVIFKKGAAPHNRAAHRKAKIPFEANDAPVAIAGVWADTASIGRYTHPGRRSHMHANLSDGSGSGHIDAIRLQRGATLFLPRTE